MTDTILAAGASGESVERLRALAAAAGVGVRQPPTPLALAEIEMYGGEDTTAVLANGAVLTGTLVTTLTWSKLRARAEERTGLMQPATDGVAQPPSGAAPGAAPQAPAPPQQPAPAVTQEQTPAQDAPAEQTTVVSQEPPAVSRFAAGEQPGAPS